MQKSLSDITSEDLKQITALAALFFTPKQVAVMLEIREDFMLNEMDHEDSSTYRAFQSGWLQGEVDLRTSIMRNVKAGSSPAQTMALDLLNKSRIKMMDK